MNLDRGLRRGRKIWDMLSRLTVPSALLISGQVMQKTGGLLCLASGPQAFSPPPSPHIFPSSPSVCF